MNNNIAALNINSAVAAIVARILMPMPAAALMPAGPAPAAATMPATDGSPAPASGVGIILNPLFQLINRAAPMDINSNQLLNSAVLQSTAQQLPAELLAKPQIVEALVLRNTLLPSAPVDADTAPVPSNPLLAPTAAATTALALSTNYRVSLQWQNRVLQFLSPEPLPTGKTVQLQINERGEVLLLPPPMPAKAAAPQTATPAVLLSGALAGNKTQAATTSASLTPATKTQPSANTPLPNDLNAGIAIKATPLQTLQQSLRETLPRQESLQTLVPLLQKLASPAVKAQLPPVVAKMLEQLLQSLPKPAQLQTADGVKHALQNSGSFLEARLAKSNAPTANINGKAIEGREPVAKILETDLKAQLTALLNIVRRLIPNTSTTTQAPANDRSALSQGDELVYSPKQLLSNTRNIAARDEDIDPTDMQLSQLSKLLQSGLARIQLNQLDSAVSRHGNSDAQLQLPAWVLELPLPTARGSDHLQVRIEQHQSKQQETRTRVQWTVQIAFDLHELGKLAATLSIVEKNVAATLWAERANTHRSVQEKIDYLRAGLESVGVKVTEMQCRLGLPPARTALVSQQLVDVHT